MPVVNFSTRGWAACVEDDGEPIIISGSCLPVCEMYDHSHLRGDELRANAHLIAAAPDLYFALEAIVQEIDEHGDDLDQWVLADLIRSAREALKKARGGVDE